MKKWLIRIALLVVVLGVAALAVVWFSLDTIVKRGVEKVGPAVTKTDVRVEGVKLSPFSGNGELSGLVVANPEGFKTPSAIQAKSIAIALEPGSVLGDKVVIRSIKLIGPQVTFEGGLQGNNLSKLLSNVKGTNQQPATKEEKKAVSRKLQVDDILITGGQVHAVVDVLGNKTVNLPEIHITQLGQGPDGITPAELTAKVLHEILQAVLTSVAGGDLTQSLKDITSGGGTNQLQKAAKGIGDLLKKK